MRQSLSAVITASALLAACSGPSQPTKTASTPPTAATPGTPTSTQPKGNVLFVNATPAAGATITLNPTSPNQAPSLIVSFEASFDTDIPDVDVQVQLLDGQGQVCGSGTSPKNSLTANGAATFTVTGFTLTCPVPMATETLKASLLPASGGAAYGQASVPAHYSFTLAAAPPPPTTAANGISLVNATPASGSEFPVTDTVVNGLVLSTFQATFNVVYSDALPDAKMEIELLDPAGEQCWFSFLDHPIPARSVESVAVGGSLGVIPGDWRNTTCGTFPEHLATVRATLLTLRDPIVNGRLTRTDYLTQTFPLVYTVDRYPPAPPSAPPTPPTIVAVTYANNVPVGRSDPPIPGDTISVGCRVAEADGAEMTISVTVAFDGVTPQKWTGTQPAGASSSPEGAFFGTNVNVPTIPVPIHLKITCDATNPRGQTASKSIDIGAPK